MILGGFGEGEIAEMHKNAWKQSAHRDKDVDSLPQGQGQGQAQEQEQ